METQKLYYEDCMLRSFTARVLDCQSTEKGFAVILDRTAFYPEGGGQACDLGTLDGVSVRHVAEEGEAVIHYCDAPILPGSCVTGQIDFLRRFDGMQAHTGEHILSGLIHAHFGYSNTGFHMGSGIMEVDFDGLLTQEDLSMLEKEANEAVWANLPIICSVPSPEELPGIVYRTKRALPWPVRIVEIPGIDTCACCGVHTAFTGQVGIIKIISCVKFRQGVRLELACGRKALEYLQKIFEQNRQVSQLFSAKMPETGAAAQRMHDALVNEKFRAAGLQKQVFDMTAAVFTGRHNVLYFADELSPAGVRDLAQAIAGRISGIAAVCSGTDENGYSLCLFSIHADVQALGKALKDSLGGRGGGKKEAFQGTVQASRRQIEAFFAERWGE